MCHPIIEQANYGTHCSALVLALLAVPGGIGAQELPKPATWIVRFDDATAPDSALYYVEMRPGWHVTSGPAAVVYDSTWTAAGRFRVEVELFLFPDASAGASGFCGEAEVSRDAGRPTRRSS